MSLKQCSGKCKQFKELNEYNNDHTSPDGKNTRCKICARERALKWRDANREKCRLYQREYARDKRAANRLNPDRNEYMSIYQRKSRLKRKYGLSLGDFERKIRIQDGLCAICGNSPTKKNLCVDHDHDTGKVRGLLCDNCNLLLGRINDDPTIIKSAAQYLEKWRQIHLYGTSKIVEIEDLVPRIECLKTVGLEIVLTTGVFDLVHVGHTRLLQEASYRGDILVVGINSDESVRKLKGNSRPLVPAIERAEILAGLSVVDYVTIFDAETPVGLINLIRPDRFCKGGDYCEADLLEAPFVKKHKGTVEILPFLRGHSSTTLIDKLAGLEGP